MSTYTPIASQTLSSAAASVTFSGIPQNYTDLILVCSGKNTGAVDNSYYLRFNSDTGSNYSGTLLYGNGSSAVSVRVSNQTSLECGRITTEFYPSIIHIMNYSNTTTNKTVLSRGGTNAFVVAWASLWRSTSAITTIDILPFGSAVTFASGSTFNLYGIASGGPKAFGGDTVTTDGTYYYHTFRSSGLFTPTQDLTNVDYLVVAGGGGGGGHPTNGYYATGGGGGAGGLRSTVTATGGGGSLESKLSLTTSTAYTITVGAGGTGRTSSDPANGSNSSITGSGLTTITSTGGGRGGSINGANNGWLQPTAGGSGGGGGENGNQPGAAGTTNQGYAGGNGNQNGGGGGGAGGVGGNGTGSSTQTGGGTAGVGLAVSISGSSTTYATGGSGGMLGTQANATANTGNGGNGGGPTAWSGGSGIVIIRYAV